MFFYTLYGLIVESNIVFPQLLENDGKSISENAADLIIKVADESEHNLNLINNKSSDSEAGDTEYGMWFSNQAGTFLLEHKDGVSYITCERCDGVQDSIVRSFILGNCIAIIMTLRRQIVLHGSTIVIGGKTVLICGDSGTGKSTTAMAFIDAGGLMLSDDISVLDVDSENGLVYSLPGFPEQKLCRDAAIDNGLNIDELTYIDEDRDKFSVDRRDIFITQKMKVDMLISLHTASQVKIDNEENYKNGVCIKKIDGADKVNAITDRFFLNWMYGHGAILQPSEMMKCFALAGQIDIYDITRVRDVDTKDSLIKRLIEIIKGKH